MALEWFNVKKNKVSPDYGQDILRSLEIHVFPYIGSLPINEIRNKTAKGTLKQLEAKGSLETVKRLCQRLNEIMYKRNNQSTKKPTFLRISNNWTEEFTKYGVGKIKGKEKRQYRY